MQQPSTGSLVMYSPVMLSSRRRSSNQCESLKRKSSSVCTGYFPPKKKFREEYSGPESPHGPLAVTNKASYNHLRRKREFSPDYCPEDPTPYNRLQETTPTKRQRHSHPDMDFSLNFNCTTSDRHCLPKQVSPAMQSPAFSTFAYFQPVIPDWDMEINQFLQDNSRSYPMREVTKKKEKVDPNFNTFNYWREPIPEIDNDMV